MRLSRSTLKTGLRGRKPTNWGWISTPPASHPLSADGFTLSHANDEIRQFWIDHCKASRRVSAYFGEQLGTPSVMNIWVPDGMKDITVDRFALRQRLLNAPMR